MMWWICWRSQWGFDEFVEFDAFRICVFEKFLRCSVLLQIHGR